MNTRRPAVSVASISFILLLMSCGTNPGPSGDSPPAPPAASAPGTTTPPSAAAPGTGPVPPTAPSSAATPTSGTGLGTGTASETMLPSPGTGSAATTTPSSSDWKTFTTSDGGLSFDYPARWSVRDPAGDMPLGGEFVDVVNENGKAMASLRTNIVTGAECMQKYPFVVFDSQPLQQLGERGAADAPMPRFVFEARGDGTAPQAEPPTVAGYGITMMPEETGSTACPMFHLFLWPPSGALFGSAYNPENNTTPGDPSLPYLEKAKLYAATPEYQDIRRMITSLRPAGT